MQTELITEELSTSNTVEGNELPPLCLNLSGSEELAAVVRAAGVNKSGRNVSIAVLTLSMGTHLIHGEGAWMKLRQRFVLRTPVKSKCIKNLWGINDF